MAPRPPLLPRSPAAILPSEPDEQGPLWDTIKRQLYRSEVSHIKRLVGESLIQQNRIMWDEIASLKQILTDFQEQNDELSENTKQQVLFCSSQHRDLLRRQAQIIIEDVRVQAESSGHELEDLIPEFRSQHLRDFVVGEDGRSLGDTWGSSCKGTPPMTPSTRPSSSGGISGCSTPDIGLPSMPLGRPLAFDEISAVAEGIREALESEKEALLATIGEEMQFFQAEELRRASTKAAPSREPSTAELQQLVHKLQDLSVNPSFRALGASGDISPATGNADPAMPGPISGGASVRRLKALIAQRRRFPTGPLPGLGAVREASRSVPSMDSIAGTTLGPSLRGGSASFLGAIPQGSGSQGAALSRIAESQGASGYSGEKTFGEMLGGSLAVPVVANAKPGFDPFFDDPFA